MPQPEDIFLQALDLTDPAERADFLAKKCGEDAELRQRLEALLADSAAAGDFFKTERIDDTRTVDPAERSDSTAAFETAEGPGAMVGRYQLLELLGGGAMGDVWLAEQREPLVRRVALKLIKLGMNTKAIIARFELERQALALMEHPNIAKVFDAGSTVTGRPYFVMELVEGLPITQFCDERKLDTRERLELFLQVCAAVQHAHQKGVIHRDLKPSNILVTMQDGEPTPKVIDFGIAKATHQPLTDKTYSTWPYHFIGTPAYMSPEQAGLGGLDVDTRSDIYSLGVLLYQLLVGRTPFEMKALFEEGREAIFRVIREEEPPKPTTKLTSLGLEELTQVAEQRKADPRKLRSLVHGDLECIVMRALEKDRDRRFPTANALAADLRRHLADEEVESRPPSAAYRFSRMVRRYRLAFAAGGAVAAALLIGIGLSTWWAVVADQARKAETEQAQKANKALGRALVAEKQAKIEQARAEVEAAKASTALVQAQQAEHQAKTEQARAEAEVLRTREALAVSELLLRRLAVETASMCFIRDSGLTVEGFGILNGLQEPFTALRRIVVDQKWLDHIRAIVPEQAGRQQSNSWYIPSFTSFSVDGLRCVTIASGGTAQVWEVRTERPVGPSLRPDGRLAFASLSPDGSRVVTVSLDDTAKASPWVARVWDVRGGAALGPEIRSKNEIQLAELSADGRLLVVWTKWGDGGKGIGVYEAATGKRIAGPFGSIGGSIGIRQ